MKRLTVIITMLIALAMAIGCGGGGSSSSITDPSLSGIVGTYIIEGESLWENEYSDDRPDSTGPGSDLSISVRITEEDAFWGGWIFDSAIWDNERKAHNVSYNGKVLYINSEVSEVEMTADEVHIGIITQTATLRLDIIPGSDEGSYKFTRRISSDWGSSMMFWNYVSTQTSTGIFIKLEG